MPRADLERLFPRLRSEPYTITSPVDPSYNCAAFAGGEQSEWWDPYAPDGTWPDGIDRDVAFRNFVTLYGRLGYVVCDQPTLEQGYEKIAIYVDGSGCFAHAARQQPSGVWVSKLGELEDIEHATLDALVSTSYGRPVIFMRRPILTR